MFEFRGKNYGAGWVTGSLVECSEKHSFIIGYFDRGEYDANEDLYKNGRSVARKVKKETVGLKSPFADIHGKPMYQNDIIRMNGNPKDLAVVRYCDFVVIDMDSEAPIEHVFGWNYAAIYTDELSACAPFCYPMTITDFWVQDSAMEVIGNTTDNPEYKVVDGALERSDT